MKGVRIHVRVLCACLMLLVALGASTTAVAFTGSLATPDCLAATGQWDSALGNTNITWVVTQNPDLTWHYKYTFNAPVGFIEGMIIEASPTFCLDNIFNLTGTVTSFSIGTFVPSEDLPNLPGPIFGINFVGANMTGLQMVAEFDSDRDPIWGDFFAHDGKVAGQFVSTWNESFLDPDPPNPPADGSINCHILVPDTTGPVIPEPGSIALAAVGLLPILGLGRKLRKA